MAAKNGTKNSRPGYAAPLHGDGMKKLMTMLNMAFSMIGLKMIADLTAKMAPQLGGPTVTVSPHAHATFTGPGIAPTNPGLHAPKPPTGAAE